MTTKKGQRQLAQSWLVQVHVPVMMEQTKALNYKAEGYCQEDGETEGEVGLGVASKAEVASSTDKA